MSGTRSKRWRVVSVAPTPGTGGMIGAAIDHLMVKLTGGIETMRE